MSKKDEKLITTPQDAHIPTEEEVVNMIGECVKEAGIPPEAVDILQFPYNLISPSPVAELPDQLLPMYVAVVKTTGMALFFPARGPHGIYQRIRDRKIH